MKIHSAMLMEEDGVSIKVTDVWAAMEQRDILYAVAQEIAKRYVAENYQKIAALIDQNAIATLTVAESAAKIRETLEKKLPDSVLKIVQKEAPEIWQRGVFGGMTKLR